MGNPNLPVRTVTSRHTAFRTLEGDGFEVRRAIPANDFEAVGPFIFLDHFGPIDVKPGEAVVVTLPVKALPKSCPTCRLVIAPLLELKAWSESARYIAPVNVS